MSLTPEEVPDRLASIGENAWPDTREERLTIEDIVRHVLAEVLPEHEETVRERVAQEIECIIVLARSDWRPGEAMTHAYAAAAMTARGGQ